MANRNNVLMELNSKIVEALSSTFAQLFGSSQAQLEQIRKIC